MSQPANESRLAEMLVSTGKLSREQLAAAIAHQQKLGGPATKALTEILVENRQVSVEDLRTVTGLVAQMHPSMATRDAQSAPAASSSSGSGCDYPGAAAQSAVVDEQLHQALADPSRRIGRYVKVNELGRGGMGVIYRGYDSQLQRNVAIKMILDDTNAEDFVRFSREARAAAKLRHPGIVAVHEVGEHEGRPFLVMDFVEGDDLEDYLRAVQLSLRQVVQIMVEVTRALDHAHEAGIIHRDIKPRNIMIDAQGHPHVMDFGLARDTSAQQQLTQTGQIMGTPAYMAPEQAMAEVGSYGPWTDVYALGAVLYQALTGNPVFRAGNAAALLQKVVGENPVPPRQVKPSLPADLETITLKCLEKEPSRRYQSAAAMADDLLRHLDGQPISARRVGRIEKTVRWARRNPALATTLTALSLVTLSAIGVVLHLRSQQQQAVEAARLEERAKISASTRRQEISAAKETEDTAFSITEQTPEGLYKLGISSHAVGDTNGAIQYFTRAIGQDQRLHKAYIARGQALRNVGDLDAAIKDITRAVDIEDTNDTRLLLSSFLVHRGNLRKNEGENQHAIADFTLAIDYYPKASSPWKHRGALLMSMYDQNKDINDLRLAIADLEQCIELEPNVWSQWHNLGVAQIMNKNYDAAIGYLSKAIELEPKRDEPWSQRGRAYGLLGNTKAAIADYKKAVGLHRNRPGTWLAIARLLAKNGDTDEAISAYNRAIKLKPDLAEAYVNRGKLRHDIGNLPGALADFTKAANLSPNNTNTWFERGLANWRLSSHPSADDTFKMNLLDLAIADYTRSIELDETNASAWIFRAAAYRDRGFIALAIASAEHGLLLDPDHPQATAVRSQLPKLREQRDEARNKDGK